MPARSAWKSALIYLGLVLTLLALPWMCISPLRWLDRSSYEPISWQMAANIFHWGALAWIGYTVLFSFTIVIGVTVFVHSYYRTFFYPVAYIDTSIAQPQLITSFGPKTKVPKWALSEVRASTFTIATISLTIPMNVSPITVNPKVRKLKYEIQFSSGTGNVTAEHMLQLVRQATKVSKQGRVDGDGTLQAVLERWLKFHLYNFNEASSRQLAELSNPLDDEQQKAFWDLVIDYFIPIVAGSGLMVHRASFELA